MSHKSDTLVRVCEDWDYAPARRCLSAMRRSGRDVYFTGHLALRRLQLEFAKVAAPIVDRLNRLLGGA